MTRVEELRRIEPEVVALGAEVVVDDVDQNHDPELVRRIDQCLERVGMAVAGVGRERQHAVIAPVAAAWKIGQWHELDGRNAEPGEMDQALTRRIETAGVAETADVQLVDHGLLPGSAAPVDGAPAVAARDP